MELVVVQCTISGVFTCAGNFYGIDAPTVLNNGVPTISMGSLAYTGGIFMATNTHNSLGTATVSIASHANVSFTVATDKISLVALGNIGASNVSTKLVFTVGGNLSIGGLSTCSFKTSESFGEETITVNGTFTSTAARTLFNGGTNELSGHKVRATFGGFVISGGNVWFSENTSDSTLDHCEWNNPALGWYFNSEVGRWICLHGCERIVCSEPRRKCLLYARS
jgi:hypothetical protein